MQKYSSKKTSVNTVSRVYTNAIFRAPSTILDYGGGKYNRNKEYMKKQKINVLVYDKFNRTKAENNIVMNTVRIAPPDYIICSNVLNVIKEDEVISEILSDIYSIASVNTQILFSVYEGNKTGIGRQSQKDCWQRNSKKEDYIKFIEKYFKNIVIKKRIIFCTK